MLFLCEVVRPSFRKAIRFFIFSVQILYVAGLEVGGLGVKFHRRLSFCYSKNCLRVLVLLLPYSHALMMRRCVVQFSAAIAFSGVGQTQYGLYGLRGSRQGTDGDISEVDCGRGGSH